MTMLSVRREVGEFRKRYKWMALFVSLVFSALIGRLCMLQVAEHERWAAEARNNIEKRIRLPATRGLIHDVNGKVVAGNRASYNVLLTPQYVSAKEEAQIASLMGLTDAERRELHQKLAAVPPRRRTHLIQMFTDITRDQYAALAMHKRELSGLDVVATPVRTYPFQSLGAHAVGFLNEVSAEDLENLKPRDYRAGDRVGRSGIERAWESYLRGRDGELRVVVNVRGHKVGGPGSRFEKKADRREPVPGRDLQLTLDMDMMRSVQRAFRGHPSGAAVVVDVQTGAVRALFSKPTYDLNEMSGKLSPTRLGEIEQNPFRPLIDKAVYESYFPGSTFKPVTALAALQDKLIDPTTRIECTGSYELGRRKFGCSHVHGEVDLREAIVQSCNVYFYKMAELVGLDRLARFSQDFGLGQKAGLGINTEASGFIPTRDWYKKGHNDQYRLGFTLNAAIGQGNTRVTLIQLGMLYAAIANGGTLYAPQLVQAVTDPSGVVVERFEPRVRRRLGVDREHLTYVIDGMFGVVNDPNGTGFEARIEGGVAVAGKTGTAQVSRRKLQPGEDPKRAWYFRRSHAWFAGFAPADDPKLAVVVLVEHGGPGGKYAAPIATQIMQEALGEGAPTGRATTLTAAAGTR